MYLSIHISTSGIASIRVTKAVIDRMLATTGTVEMPTVSAISGSAGSRAIAAAMTVRAVARHGYRTWVGVSTKSIDSGRCLIVLTSKLLSCAANPARECDNDEQNSRY